MTKAALMSTLAEQNGLPKAAIVKIFTDLTDLAYSETKSNGEFVIPGIGKLVKVARAARVGRNPATGASINIPAKTVVKFRVAKIAKESCI